MGRTVGRGPSGSIPDPPSLAGPAPASLRSACSPLPACSLSLPVSSAWRSGGCRGGRGRPSSQRASSVLGQLAWQARARLGGNLFLPRARARPRPARSRPLPPSRRRSRGSLLHADPGRRPRRPALRADAAPRASPLSGCCSTSLPGAGSLKSFVSLWLDRLLVSIFRALRFSQEPRYRSPPSLSPNLWMRLYWQI